MDNLKRLNPQIHKMVWNMSPKAVTAINYLIDPIVEWRYAVASGYELLPVTSKYNNEFQEALGKIAPYKKLPMARLHNMLDGAISLESAHWLYNMVRDTKPELILETGISLGFSTAILLEALNKNGFGELYSTDVFNEVGFMTWNVDKSKWHKCIGNPKSILRTTLKKLKGKKIDIFLHDSNHSYKNMKYEFNLVFPHLKNGGWIMSDDIEENKAFSEFCKTNGDEIAVVYSPQKLFGVCWIIR